MRVFKVSIPLLKSPNIQVYRGLRGRGSLVQDPQCTQNVDRRCQDPFRALPGALEQGSEHSIANELETRSGEGHSSRMQLGRAPTHPTGTLEDAGRNLDQLAVPNTALLEVVPGICWIHSSVSGARLSLGHYHAAVLGDSHICQPICLLCPPLQCLRHCVLCFSDFSASSFSWWSWGQQRLCSHDVPAVLPPPSASLVSQQGV